MQQMDKQAVMAVALRNWWISGAAAIADGDPFAAAEYRLTEESFSVVYDINKRKRLFEHGNWCMNQAFIFKNLAFINQVNGGDEWYTIKQFGFECIEYMNRLLKASKEQCQKLTY